MTDMANCSYSAPSQTELAASGDQLYGPRICNQAFIDWAWDAHDFDNGAWRWHVCWLAWFAFAGVRASQAMKTIAKQRANSILATRFTTPPGIAI